VVHTCNTSKSGGRDQEAYGSKPTLANSSRAPISKKTLHKIRAGGVAQGVGPEFKPQHRKKQTNKKHNQKTKPTKTFNAVNTLKLLETLRELANFNVQGICFSGRKTG
jgi:hypothetical protein